MSGTDPSKPVIHGAEHDPEGNDPITYAKIWPVGAVFIAVVSTNPGTLLGFGTWVAFGAGKVLVGLNDGDADFDTAEEEGGSKTHTLIEAEMPAHVHKQSGATSTSGGAGLIAYDVNSGGKGADQNDTASAGSGDPHNNVQPYIVVYMWKRTE